MTMRIIKFRAVSLCKGEGFVYGDLRHYNRNPRYEKWTIHDPDTGIETDIDETTIGQYTGLYDKNGKEIYEGDIVKVDSLWCEKICTMIVSWAEDKGRWIMYYTKNHGYLYPQDLEEIEVIGNIYEKEYQDEH